MVVNKICYVEELLLFTSCFLVALNDCTWDDANVVCFGKCLVFFEVQLPLSTETDKVRVLGDPVSQVVFWEDRKLCALRCGAFDEFCCFSVIGFYLQRLVGGQQD